MIDTEYTPSEDELREAYVWLSAGDNEGARDQAAEDFNRGLARVRREAKAEAWDEGHSWGWSDAQDAHDVRQEMDRADWSSNTPNPYRQENDR